MAPGTRLAFPESGSVREKVDIAIVTRPWWITEVVLLAALSASSAGGQAPQTARDDAGPGFVGHAGVSAGDWGAVVLQAELMSLPEADRVTNPGTVFLGLRAGSYPAVAVGSFLAWFADFVTQFD